MTTNTEETITFSPVEDMYHRSEEGKPALSFRRKVSYEGTVHTDGRISAIHPRTKQRTFVSAQYINIHKGAMYV